MPTQPITLHSHWQHKKTAAEVVVTRDGVREVSYVAVDRTFSGTVSRWVFLEDFEPVAERRKKER